MPTIKSFFILLGFKVSIIILYFLISFLDPGYLPVYRGYKKLLELIERASMDNICTDCIVI